MINDRIQLCCTAAISTNDLLFNNKYAVANFHLNKFNKKTLIGINTNHAYEMVSIYGIHFQNTTVTIFFIFSPTEQSNHYTFSIHSSFIRQRIYKLK